MKRERTFGLRRMGLQSILLLLTLHASFAQTRLATIYVDALNGSDSFSGANPTDTLPGSGPKSTIHAGLTALADGGRLVLFAGVYPGDGIDTDGSPTNVSDNADINIALSKYPQFVKGLTIELRSLGANNEVRIVAEANSLRAPNGALITHDADQYIPNFLFNIPGGTLTFTTTNGSEYLSLAGQHSSGNPVAGISLLAGTIDIARGSSFRLLNGATITVTGSSRFSREAPQKQSDVNLTYLGGGSLTAGAEASYTSFGSGILTVAKDSGTTITFPYPTAFSGNNDAIRVQSGNAVFNGSLTLGSGGDASARPATADLVVSTTGNVTFNAPVALTVVHGAIHDTSISTIDNAGPGTVSFQQAVTWYAAAPASDRAFPALETTALVWNAGNGSMTFDAGIVLSHAVATGVSPANVEVSIQNNGRGSLRFGGPVQVVSRSIANLVDGQRFSAAVFNAGGGTLEISGTLGARLVNARAGQLAGTVNITGPTTLGTLGTASGTLVNARDAVINLGPNTLTLSGEANQLVNGSYFTSTSGGFLIDAAGAVGFDGGSLPRITVQQPLGGSTVFSSAASCNALTVNSGDCLLQSSVSVGGAVELAGGSLTIQDRAGTLLLAGSFRQTGGVLTLGGATGGVLKLLGDFVRTGGSFNAGSSSSVIVAGSSPQTLDPGPSLQLGTLVVENTSSTVRCLRPLRVSTNLAIGSGARLSLGTSTILLNGLSAVFTNNGAFDASGLGIVIGGTSTLPSGASLTGCEIHAGPGSMFASFTIDVGIGNVCTFKGDEAVSWDGTLSLLSGALDVASPIDFSPGGPSSKLLIDIMKSKSIVRSKGSFNASGTRFTLQLTGVLQADLTMQPELIADLINVDTLAIDVNSDTDDNDGNLMTGQLRYFQFPSGVFAFGGSLLVGPLSAVRLQGDGKSGGSIELTGSLASHRVRGILTTADDGDAVVIGGEKAALTGSDLSGDAALVGNIAVRSSTLCRISAIRGFLGSITTLPGSSLAISMGDRDAEQPIAGQLILNGNLLTLEGNIEVRKGVAFNSGKLNFGTHNLRVSYSGDFVQGPSAIGYAASGGSLIMNRPQGHLRIGSTEQLGLPNLQILANTYLDTLGRVTNNLVIGSNESAGIPTLILGRTGNDLIFTGSAIRLLSNGSGNRAAIVSDGTTDGTAGGRLFVIGTSVTLVMNGDFSVEELVYNPPAIDGTLSILSTDMAPRILTISDILTHAGGQIGLGFNHLALTGTGVKPGRRAYNRSDGTIGASSGEVRFVGRAPQQFSCGFASSMPNLRIWNPSGVSKSGGSDPMIVTKTLDLSDGAFSFEPNNVIIENGATVVRRRSGAILGGVLSFRSSVNVAYDLDSTNGTLRTSSELPADPSILTSLRVCNPHPVPDSALVILSGDATVKERIVLEAGRLDVGNSILKLAAGGTIEVNGGKIQAAQGSSGRFLVTSYNVSYSKSGVVNSASLEFQSGPGISVSSFTVLGPDPKMATIVRLYANRTVEKFAMNAPSGGIEFGAPGSFVARNLTIRDSMTILGGGFTNTSGTNAVINLAGTKQQIVTLPDSGSTLPGGASAIHLQLNNAAGFRLLGGDLRLSSGAIIFFVNGVLDAGEQAVVLSHSVTSQGFDRQGVGTSNVSHVVGRVKQSITGGAGNQDVYPNGRYEFPTGTATRYRPLILTFTSTYPARNPGTIEVEHINALPTGNAGLPLDGGLGVRVGGYAPYYWSVKSSSGSLGDGQRFDLETSIETPGFRISKLGDLRIIRRVDSSPDISSWSLLGPGAGYGASNLTVNSRGDTVLSVRVLAAGEFQDGASLVTIGLPLDKKPFLNYRVPSTIARVPLNEPTIFRVSVSDPDKKALTISWKVNGTTVMAGADTSFTYTFQGVGTTQSVRAVFRNEEGFADSTEWNFTVVGISEEGTDVPGAFVLYQNFPNPFNPTTSIRYEVPATSSVTLKAYDMLGKEVAVLAGGIRVPGSYIVRWDATGLPSGMYVCRFIATELFVPDAQIHVQMIRMLLMK